jgi:hypothetical protein
LSVSAFESLGRCPLRYFFERVLGIDPPPEPVSELGLAEREIGLAVHVLLETLYQALRDEGRFDGQSEHDLVERAIELLETRRESIFGSLSRRLARRLPLLWETQGGRWLETLRRFLRADLHRIHSEGLTVVSFEDPVTVDLDLGDGCRVTVRGRFDRTLALGDRLIVGDYKASPRLGGRVDPTRMLKAQTLQVPLYRMMAGEGAWVELLGVHPDLDVEDDAHRLEFPGFEEAELEGSFRDSMRALVVLRERGVYPFNPCEENCRWCRFKCACRRNHAPTLERERLREDSAAFRALGKKSKTNPHG